MSKANNNRIISEIELIKNQITSALEQVTMHGINLKTLGITKVATLSEKNDLSSEDGLVKEYKRLSVQLKQLQILEKRYTDTMETLRKDEITVADDIKKFSNLDVSSSEYNSNQFILNVPLSFFLPGTARRCGKKG